MEKPPSKHMRECSRLKRGSEELRIQAVKQLIV
jgi:hypothetical protein